jgi:TolB-like protein/thioredoxin-like negative regulator of GroEL
VTSPPGDRLDSWKEIAAYVNRGVRTVRRWEADEGLPVHRQVHRTAGSVYAFKSEIDRWRAAQTRGAAPPRPDADAMSVAVLPFTNLSADPENAFFADGLTDDVTADLSGVRALRVTSRTSSMTFKGSGKGLKAIAADLGVRYVLQGSVRRTGDRLRITAQLIDAGTDSHLWTGKFDGSAEDVFSMQERLARTIVDALAVRLSVDEQRRLSDRPIADLQAYECYVRAREEGWRWRKDAIDRAVRLLRNGLEIVGPNAHLSAALGLAYLQYREAGIDVGDGPIEEAERCARDVFAIDPASDRGLQLRGWIHYARGRIRDAIADLAASLAADPGNADTVLLLANCYLIAGRVSLARPLIERLVAIDPLTPISRCMPAWADALEGKWEAAIEPYAGMFSMDPANPMARLFYVWVLAANRRDAEARELAASMPLEAVDTVPGRLCAALACALARDLPGLDACVTPRIEEAARATDVFPRFLAHAFALAGDRTRALQWLAIAVDRGFVNYPSLSLHDPFFRDMRGDPDFVRLLADVKDRWERFGVSSPASG